MNRIQKLETLIIKYKALYYQGRPEITDLEYDKLEDELRTLDPENSTLQIVGSTSSSSDKIKHDKKMLSLEKTYLINDLVEWMGNEEIISTFKLDGISCSLIYENGHLKLAKTRGDGSFGESITPKIMWISSIPKLITNKNKIEIRGELYCSEDSFFHLSDEMVKLEFEKPTSQRNIVAGLMGRKDNLEFCRHINFMAFDLIHENHTEIKKEIEKYNELSKLGFEIPDVEIHKTKESLEKTIENAKTFMSEGEYQIDGLVFTFNNIQLHEELGETSHHPRYKMAFKFQGESKATIIKDIVWSISRNGILTPVGEVEPVELSGAMISRVTLHNYGLVKQFNLKAGDKIEIIRSGEVIPKFLSVIESSSEKFKIPSTCPSCNEEVTIEDIRIFCRNPKCTGKNKEIILNFIQKIGIEDLSSKRLEEMISANMVKSIPDLYRLNSEDLLSLDKVKEKLSNKLIESIAKTKKVNLITFLSALGISGGAFNKCEKVVRAGFDTIEEKKETKISGMKICITGALSEKRNLIEDRIRECGGIVVSSVSKNTDILVTNETDPSSSKYKKAIELKIKIITEKELMELMK